MERFSYHNGHEQTVFKQMSPENQTKFLQELKQDYQQII